MRCKFILGIVASGLFIKTAGALDVNLSNGKFPAHVTSLNEAGIAPDASFYKNGWTRDGWLVDRFGSRGYVALSPTHTETDIPCKNRLNISNVSVQSGMWLSWEACSVMADFPESYSVEVIGSNGQNPEILARIEGESATWHPRMVSLEKYSGQTVTVSFVCTSVNRFMLALDKISMTVPSEISFTQLADDTPAFCTLEGNEVVISLLNSGKDVEVQKVSLRGIGGTLLDEYEENETWTTADIKEIRFDITDPRQGKNIYGLYLDVAGGQEIKVAEGEFYASKYLRHEIIDKGTGMWCPNCPAENVILKPVKNKLGSRGLTVLESHANDALNNAGYIAGLGYRALPEIKLNRIASTTGASVATYPKYYAQEPRFGISLVDIEVESDDMAVVTVKVAATEATDNATDRYRVGYVLAADIAAPCYINGVELKLYQQNNSSTPAYEEYYFLPSIIPSELIVFHNVTLNSEYAFNGFARSLPSMMEAGEWNQFTFRVQRAPVLDNIRNGKAACFVLDTLTGEILNAGFYPIGKETTGIGTPVAEYVSDLDLHHNADGTFRVRSAGNNGKLTAYDLSGRAVDEVYVAKDSSSVALNLPTGIYIVVFTDGISSARIKTVVGE